MKIVSTKFRSGSQNENTELVTRAIVLPCGVEHQLGREASDPVQSSSCLDSTVCRMLTTGCPRVSDLDASSEQGGTTAPTPPTPALYQKAGNQQFSIIKKHSEFFIGGLFQKLIYFSRNQYFPLSALMPIDFLLTPIEWYPSWERISIEFNENTDFSKNKLIFGTIHR